MSTATVVPEAQGQPQEPASTEAQALSQKLAKAKPSKPPRASKKPSRKKSPAKKKPAKKSRPKDQDRENAKRLGLGLIHYRVLNALFGCGGELTYRDIEGETGYYAPLAGIMHTDEKNGLVPQGLAIQSTTDIDGREKMAFRISAKGRKLIAKLEKK